MKSIYKGYNITKDSHGAYIYDPGNNLIDSTEKIEDAKKKINRWIKDKFAAQGEISNIKKVAGNITYKRDDGNFGVYNPKTKQYAVFDKKPTQEYVASFQKPKDDDAAAKPASPK